VATEVMYMVVANILWSFEISPKRSDRTSTVDNVGYGTIIVGELLFYCLSLTDYITDSVNSQIQGHQRLKLYSNHDTSEGDPADYCVG
jgi:hypothetical protein